ncbi:MAG: hypothetical protein KGQ37_05860 [Hyphomicrobiales bacterium]|nr:hypothetical protein [Hyphomicrobiales bacterium]
MSDGNKSNQIGAIGEGRFKELCDLAQLSASKPHPDMTGIDYLVEFPFQELPPGYSYDTRPGSLSCHVQVKTVSAGTQRIKLKLSVAERLARETKPTFIYILRVDCGKSHYPNVDAHLIHLHGQVLARVLERLRQEYVKDTKALNKLYIYFPIEMGTLLQIDASCLRHAFESAIQPDMYSYIEEKKRQLSELGYGSDRYELDVTFQPMTAETFAEVALGLKETNVTNFAISERRFNIALPKTFEPFDESAIRKIRIQPGIVDRCSVCFTGKDGKKAMLQGDIYLPLPGLKLPHRFARVATPLIDILLFADNRIRFIPNIGTENSQSFPINVWHEAFTFTQIMLNGGGQIMISPDRIRSIITTAIDTTTTIAKDKNDDDVIIISAIINVTNAAKYMQAKAYADDHNVSYRSLAFNIVKLDAISAIMRDEVPLGMIKFTIESDYVNKLDSLDFIYFDCVRFGEFFYAYAIKTTTTQVRDGNSTTWSSEKLNLLDVKRLGANFAAEFEGFKQKLCHISGIHQIYCREVIFDTEAEEDLLTGDLSATTKL